MVKGVAVNFKSYEETIPKLLNYIKFDEEIRKHNNIVLKPNLIHGNETSTSPEFVEPVLKFIMQHRNPGAEVVIAEGCDGKDTMDVFENLGYTALAAKYGVGLVDLSNTETQEIQDSRFLSFSTIKYPALLLDSFIVTLPALSSHDEIGISASLHCMLGAFPAKHYKGFFSSTKNKLNKHPIEYQIHDIIMCKMPDFSIIDASDRRLIIIGQPFEMDKQAARALKQEWSKIPYLRLIHQTRNPPSPEQEDKQISELIGSS